MNERTTFWARRKAAVDAEAKDAEFAALEESRAAQDAAVADKSDEELLAELNLPDPDTLVSGDDVKAFMQHAVPERLRRRALRALWRTNPVLANLDTLVDYGEDYTDAALVVENMATTYQVGKGMLAHVEKMAEDAAKAAEQDAEAQQAEAAEDHTDDHADDIVAPETDRPEPEHEAPAPEYLSEATPQRQDAEEAAFVAPSPRRMTFSYKADSA